MKGNGTSFILFLAFIPLLTCPVVICTANDIAVKIMVSYTGFLFTLLSGAVFSKHPVFRGSVNINTRQKKENTISEAINQGNAYLQKNSSMIYVLPFSRNDIIRSYVLHACTAQALLIISMLIFGIFSAASLLKTDTCIFGSIVFVLNAIILPLSNRSIKKYSGEKLNTAGVFCMFIMVIAVIMCTAPSYIPETHAVSVTAGIITAAAASITAARSITFHRKLINDSSEYSISGEPVKKEIHQC